MTCLWEPPNVVRFGLLCTCPASSVADRKLLISDPDTDPTCPVITDPDPTLQVVSDPDSVLDPICIFFVKFWK